MAAAPVQDEDGHVVSHLVVYNDISVAKRQEARLQALIDSSPLGIVEFDLETSVRLWNPAAERIFGWTREEIVGRGGLPMAPESRRAESEALFTRVLAGESVNDFETVRQRKDGTLVAVSIAAAPITRRVRPGRREHGRVHRHRRAEGAGGGGAPPQRRAPCQARRARRLALADRRRRRRRTPPPRAEPPRRRAAAPGRAVLRPSSDARRARLRPGRRPRSPRTTPATSSRSRSTSSGSSPVGSTRPCSPSTACAPPSRRSRGGRRSRSRSRTSRTSGCRSRSRLARTTWSRRR